MTDEQLRKLINAIESADPNSYLSDLNQKLDAIITLLKRIYANQK